MSKIQAVVKGSHSLFQIIMDHYYDCEESLKAMFQRLIWKRVALALILILGFGYGTVHFVMDSASAYLTWEKKHEQKSYQEEIARYEQVEVRVNEGDTAWTIQQALTPHESDLRHSLYLSEQLNKGADFGNLLPGQIFIFLKEKPHEN